MNSTKELEARLSVLSAFVGGILFEVDADGHYLEIRTGEPGLLARPAEELLGKNVLEVIGTELGQSFIDTFRRVLATGVPETFDYVLDVVAGRRNFRSQIRPTPLQDSNGRRTVTILVRDTTEETELKAKLVEAERRAAMGLVAASIGHEIRQPLAFATTSLDVLLGEIERRGGGERAREALAHVRDALQRIGTIAASVVMVAPDGQGVEAGDVQRPTLAAVDLCASQLQGRAKVVVDVPGLPHVAINEGQLCQIVTNLLLNAAHALEGADPTAHRIDIRATLSSDERQITLAVTDDGCGIAPTNIGRIFDPFFTTKPPGQGTGLGLYVTKRIVESAGGSLTIESAAGKGTVALVTLPVAAPSELLVPVKPSTSRARSSILVVDDEPSFLRSLQLVLESTHDVVACSKSVEALELVRSDPTRFAAILCDISMPLLDGVSFYKHIASLGLSDRFIIMTAGAFTARAEEFLKNSKCRRIGKPFTLDVLLTVLSAVTNAVSAVS